VTADLIAFLGARLDEDEQIARAALTPGTRWMQGTQDSDHGVAAVWQTSGLDNWDRCSEHAGVLNLCDDAVVAVCDDFHGMTPVTNGAHIARQDPHRTLREVEFKRQLLAEHSITNDSVCSTCVTGKWGYPVHGGSDPQPYPCRTLRLLAQRDADHDDFDPAWSTE